MATEKTTNNEWDKPVFPSDNLPTELTNLIEQIDATAGGSDEIFLAEGTDTDINGSNVVSWNSVEAEDSPFLFGGDTLIFDEDGTYEIRADADFYSATTRTNPNLRIEYYDGTWNWIGVFGKSGYTRVAEGHRESSVHTSAIKVASSGDQIRIVGHQEASGRTIVPDRSQFYVKKLNR